MRRRKPSAAGAVETSHGRDYLVGPRLSDLGDTDGGTDELRSRNHDERGLFAPGNRAAVGRGPKRAIFGSIADLIERGAGGSLEATEASETAEGALKLYDATKANLGSEDPRVLAPALRFSVDTMLAGVFTRAAGKAGFTSKEGMVFLEMAWKAEQRADRSSVQATALAARLAMTFTPRPTVTVDWQELDRRQREQALAAEPSDSPAFASEPDEVAQ